MHIFCLANNITRQVRIKLFVVKNRKRNLTFITQTGWNDFQHTESEFGKEDLVEVGNDSVNNLLCSAVSTKIFSHVLPLRNHALHCSLESVSKWRKLKMPQHHCWGEKQRNRICLLLLHLLFLSHISSRSTLLKHSMISPNVSCSAITSNHSFLASSSSSNHININSIQLPPGITPVPPAIPAAVLATRFPYRLGVT